MKKKRRKRFSKKKKARLKKLFIRIAIKLVILALGLFLTIFSGYKFISQLLDYKKAEEIYIITAQQYVTQANPAVDDGNSDNIENTENSEEDAANDENTVSLIDWWKMVDVNLESLETINSDIVGWIYFENEDISYPVVYSEDNANYLNKAYTGEETSAGSIFMDMNNSRDFSDAHTLIYGHNMKNLTMFGRLKYYAKDEEYINEHQYFQIITKEKKYRYKIFSYKIVEADSSVYQIFANGDSGFYDFLNNILKKGSYYVGDTQPKNDDHVITLSTCTGNDKRLIVSAVRLAEF